MFCQCLQSSCPNLVDSSLYVDRSSQPGSDMDYHNDAHRSAVHRRRVQHGHGVRDNLLEASDAVLGYMGKMQKDINNETDVGVYL